MNPTLQKVFDIFDTISHWIPHALGVLLLLGLLYFVYYKVKNRKTDEPEGDEESNDSLGNHRSHRSASWFRLRRNLRRALSTLKANVYGRHHRYQIPWFLLIGETGSGKTEALHHTDITLPLGAPRENIEGSREGWKWWFFDQGIVIDVDGDYVLRTDGHPTDHKGWKQLLKLLQNHRPQRPIDGIILTRTRH
jgi:type VI protein secretion system component VasK